MPYFFDGINVHFFETKELAYKYNDKLKEITDEESFYFINNIKEKAENMVSIKLKKLTNIVTNENSLYYEKFEAYYKIMYYYKNSDSNIFTKKIFEDLEMTKYLYLSILPIWVSENLSNGYLVTTINKQINSTQLDLINLQILYSTTNSNEIMLRLFDNSFIKITKTQLEQIINELSEHILYIYNLKWKIEEFLTNMNSVDELKNNFEYLDELNQIVYSNRQLPQKLLNDLFNF